MKNVNFQIYGNVSTWPAKIVAAAGSIIAGLSPSEIQELNGLNGVDVMYNIGRHRKLSTEQVGNGLLCSPDTLFYNLLQMMSE